METEYLKTLWMLRFEKIKSGEVHAIECYQEILAECSAHFGQDDETTHLLMRLVREERAHEKLAEELIRICRCNHPEVSALGLDDCGPSSKANIFKKS